MSFSGTVTYAAVSGNGRSLFAVHPGTGAVTTAGDVDRELRGSYSLVVRASDGGAPPLSSTALVDITVSDLNDNRPQFTPRAFTVTVGEDAAVGSSVTTVSAADADTAVSNNVFSYVLIDNHFAADGVTGVLTVRKKLDREDKDK